MWCSGCLQWKGGNQPEFLAEEKGVVGHPNPLFSGQGPIPATENEARRPYLCLEEKHSIVVLTNLAAVTLDMSAWVVLIGRSLSECW